MHTLYCSAYKAVFVSLLAFSLEIFIPSAIKCSGIYYKGITLSVGLFIRLLWVIDIIPLVITYTLCTCPFNGAIKQNSVSIVETNMLQLVKCLFYHAPIVFPIICFSIIFHWHAHSVHFPTLLNKHSVTTKRFNVYHDNTEQG